VTPLQAIYLDFLNNFLTVERFAEHYGLEQNEAQSIINKGRDLHNSITEDHCGFRNVQTWCVTLTFSNDSYLHRLASKIARDEVATVGEKKARMAALAEDHVTRIFAMAPWVWADGQSFDSVHWKQVINYFEQD